jgi:hypothetical protein
MVFIGRTFTADLKKKPNHVIVGRYGRYVGFLAITVVGKRSVES